MNTYIIIGIALGLLIFIIFKRSIFGRNDISDVRRNFGPDELMNNERMKFAVNEFIKKGKKLDAIKFLHEQGNVGLLDAKDFVEKIENMNRKGNGNNPDKNSNNDVFGDKKSDSKNLSFSKIKALLSSGDKITAIKLAVEENRMGLDEAKEYIEKIGSDIENKKL